MIRAGLLAASLLLGTAASAAPDLSAVALQAADDLQAASRSLEAADGARNRVKALTGTVEAYENGLAALRAGMRLAARRERALQASLAARDEEISQLLAALTAMGRSPAPLLLLHPSGPIGTARSGMILSDVTPDVQAEVEALRRDLEEIDALRALQTRAGGALASGLQGAQEARTALSQAMSDRKDLPRRFTADPERMRQLLETADSLDGFAAGLMVIEPGIADDTGFETLRGSLPLPVQGVVLRGYRQADAAGVARPGLLIATRPGALVTAPSEGTIRYVGPLLDYGNVMILEPADDVLLVLAGVGTVYGDAGEVVQAGAALGLMGGRAPEGSEFLSEPEESGGAERSETLYIELREGETPVDPTNWFAATQEK